MRSHLLQKLHQPRGATTDVRPSSPPLNPFDEPLGLQEYASCTCPPYMPSSRFFHIASFGITLTMLSLKLVRSFLHYPHPFGLTTMSCTVYEVCDHLLLFDVEALSAPQRPSP